LGIGGVIVGGVAEEAIAEDGEELLVGFLLDELEAGLLEDAREERLKMAMSELSFSARAYDRILKVARTIADSG